MPSEISTTCKPRSTQTSRRVVRWAAAFLMLGACALLIDVGHTANILMRASPTWIVVILALWTVDRFLMAWKWSFLLRSLNVQIPLSTLVRFYYQGSFTGTFLPSSFGGDILRAYWVSRSSGATHEVYAAVVMEKVIGLLSAANWAVAGTVVFAVVVASEIGTRWVAAALAGALLLNVFFIFSLQPSCSRLLQRILARIPWYGVLNFFRRVGAAYSRFSHSHQAVLLNAVLTVLEHGLQILIVFAMAKSLDIRADTLSFLAVTAVYLLIYRLPVAPDGWGIGEVAAVGLFGLIGVSAENGFALAFLSHVLQTIVILPGFWFLWRSGWSVPQFQVTREPSSL